MRRFVKIGVNFVNIHNIVGATIRRSVVSNNWGVFVSMKGLDYYNSTPLTPSVVEFSQVPRVIGGCGGVGGVENSNYVEKLVFEREKDAVDWVIDNEITLLR